MDGEQRMLIDLCTWDLLFPNRAGALKTFKTE